MSLYLAAIADLLWLYTLGMLLVHGHRRRYAADLPDEAPPNGWPGLTVIFAARNEAAGIEAAARSMAQLAYPGVTIRAVNDRSTDETGAILKRLATQYPALDAREVTELPPGWLGKNHALHAAARGVTTEWLLFTDGDVQFAPDAVRRIVAFAEREQADHVTVYPEMIYEDLGGKLFVLLFGLLFGIQRPVWEVENPKSRNHLGIGAFNLVRRRAFERIDGFEHLKLSVDDDVRLAEALKVHGFRSRPLQGVGMVKVKWQNDVWSYVRGVEKNAFAGMNFFVPMVLWASFGTLVAGIAPHFALLFGDGLARLAGLVGVAAIAAILQLTKRNTRLGPLFALGTPVSALLLTLAMLRSLVMTLKRRGIDWRDHHYALAELRAHVRERNAWTSAAWKQTKRSL